MVSGFTSYMDLVDSWEGVDNAKIASLVGAEPLDFPTGSRHEYSNTDYNLLATVVARASGKPFGEYLAEKVFAPLGMESSVVLERAGQPIPHRVYGYREGDDGEWDRDVDDTPGIVGDGSLFSTAGDLARYAVALQTGKILSPEELALSIEPGRLDSGEPHGYAFGWQDWSEEERAVAHGGSWAGTTSSIYRGLDRRLTIIVLANAVDLDLESPATEIAEIFEE